MAVPAAYLRYLREQTAGLPARYTPGAKLEDALANPRLLVTGPPGSGKSDFLRWVAWLWCCGLEDARTEWLPMPFLIRVPELPHAPGPVIDLLRSRSRALGWGLADDFIAEKLLRGASVLLLDDLEPSSDPQRQLVETAAGSFRAARFIVAAAAPAHLAGFETASIVQPPPGAAPTG